jgi:ankyrin repeat protein
MLTNKHNMLLRFMKRLKFLNLDPGGICEGYAGSGLNAFLCNDMKKFDDRMLVISDYNLYKTSFSKDDISFLYDPEHEIMAFLNSLIINFNPSNFKELFDKKTLAPRMQDIYLASKIVESEKLRSMGGLYKGPTESCHGFSGNYSKEELGKILQSFKSIVENKKITFPIGFVFHSINHSITVGFDPISDKWSYIDANFTPTTYTTNEDEITKLIMEGFVTPLESSVICSVSPYVTENNKILFDQTMIEWKNTQEWKTGNEISTLKLNIGVHDSSLLCLAALEGHLELVDKLLKNENLFPNSIREDQKTKALFLASQNGHLNIVEKLIEKGAEVNAFNQDGVTVLGIAIFRGQIETVKALIQNGAEINKGTRNGNTPIMVAALSQEIDVINILIENGAELEAVDKNKKNALMYAALGGSSETIALLMKTGKINIDAVDEDGNTALMLAASEGNTKAVNTLIKYGANTNIANKNGLDALKIAKVKNNATVVNALNIHNNNSEKFLFPENEFDVAENLAKEYLKKQHGDNPPAKVFFKLRKKDYQEKLNNSYLCFYENGEIKVYAKSPKDPLGVGWNAKTKLGIGRNGVYVAIKIKHSKPETIKEARAAAEDEKNIAENFEIPKNIAERESTSIKDHAGKEIDTNASSKQNQIKIYEVSNYFGYSLEFLMNPELNSFIEITEPMRFQIGYAIISAVKEFHRKGYLHCDIHPGNICVNFDEDGNAKISLIDFGQSIKIQHNSAARITINDWSADRGKRNLSTLLQTKILPGNVTSTNLNETILSSKTDLHAAALILKDTLQLPKQEWKEFLIGSDLETKPTGTHYFVTNVTNNNFVPNEENETNQENNVTADEPNNNIINENNNVARSEENDQNNMDDNNANLLFFSKPLGPGYYEMRKEDAKKENEGEPTDSFNKDRKNK